MGSLWIGFLLPYSVFGGRLPGVYYVNSLLHKTVGDVVYRSFRM
jgi:hypothetical protein